MGKRNILLVAALFAITLSAESKVRLPHLIGDGMVIQQNSGVRLWGWDTPGAKITVSTSWSKEKEQTTTDSDGRWLVTVKAPAASFAPLSVTIDDGEPVTVNDILAGEVWVCAGQSNMEMPVEGFTNCPVEGYTDWVLDAAQSKGVRSVKIPARMSMTPLDDAPCQWRQCSPSTVGAFSATGYFFARLVSRTLGIPVGLIEANKGGTRVESWLDRDNLEAHTQEVLDSMEMVKRFYWDYHRPLLWGNGTFHPILNYTVRGILFYQGCSNVGDPPGQYTERLKLLVEQWRRDFALGELPFYFVQIAPYGSGDCMGDWNARLQEQQFNATKVIPNSAMVCTNDCVYPYETTQIHPCQKKKVGERLAYIALNKLYDMPEVICESPSYKSMEIKGDSVFIQLDDPYGTISRYEDLQGFELAGNDSVFHPANATYYYTKGIILTSPEVKEPVSARYCFRNFLIGNVKNKGGLPLIPFRTDNW